MNAADWSKLAVDAVREWASRHDIRGAVGPVYVFGSTVYQDGAQFDQETSDVDILIACPDFVSDAVHRVRVAEDLLSKRTELEVKLVQVLRRESAAKPVTSMLLAANEEIQRNIHKTVPDRFFQASAFLDVASGHLGFDGGSFVPLDRARNNGAITCAAATQAQRNAFLAVSANGSRRVKAWEPGSDPLPKDLMRVAAQLRYCVEQGSDGSEFDVNRGLEFCTKLLESAPPAEQELRRLRDWLSVARGGRGMRTALPPRDLLLFYEVLYQVAIDWLLSAPIQSASSGSTTGAQPPIAVHAAPSPELARAEPGRDGGAGAAAARSPSSRPPAVPAMPGAAGRSRIVPVPRALKARIDEGRCILFLGAGASARACDRDGRRLPSWTSMVKELVETLGGERPHSADDEREITELLSYGELLAISEWLDTHLSRDAFAAYLQQRLGTARTSPLHEILSTKKFAAVMTTNYDELAELYWQRAGRIPLVTTPHTGESDIAMARRNLDRPSDFIPIIKPHGTWSRPDTIVFGPKAYRDIMYANQPFRQFMFELFSRFTVLFVGFSFRDPNFQSVLQWVYTEAKGRVPLHYGTLENRGEVFRLYMRQNFGIELLTYSVPLDAPEDHSQIEGILKAL